MHTSRGLLLTPSIGHFIRHRARTFFYVVTITRVVDSPDHYPNYTLR